MPRASDLSISYGSFLMGGSSPYRVHGPHILEISNERLRITADVVVLASSQTELVERSQALELALRARQASLGIRIGEGTWTFPVGAGVLNSTASARKSGNPQIDRGLSRGYTVTLEGELPAGDRQGLRTLNVGIEYSDARQRTVSFSGLYTSLGAGALQQYESAFPREARGLLDLIDRQASWQLIGERATPDTFNHLCQFAQDWQEVLANQTEGRRLDSAIRNHRIRFTATNLFPGDARDDVGRLRYVQGTYECAVDVTETDDLSQVFEDKIRPHVVALFRDEFEPRRFAIEELSPSYELTGNRISASFRFLFQPRKGAQDVVELTQSVTIDEEAGDTYTPTHDGKRYSAYVDVGAGLRLRYWRRTVKVIGAETPKERIGASPKAGPAGLFGEVLPGITDRVDTGSERKIVPEGWNLVHNTSTAFHSFHGESDGEEEQLELSGLEEVVVERYVEAPDSGGGSGGPPTTRSGR